MKQDDQNTNYIKPPPEAELEKQENHVKQAPKTKLNLAMTNISNEGIIELISQNQISCVQEMYLDSNPLWPIGMETLTRVQWINLKILTLQNTNLGCEGVRYLVKKQWPALRTLSLKGNGLGQQASKNLSKIRLPKLRKLFIGSNKLNQKCMQVLVFSEWQQIRVLKLSSPFLILDNNFLGWFGCLGLCLCNSSNLSKVYIRGNGIKPNLRSRLIQTLPELWCAQML